MFSDINRELRERERLETFVIFIQYSGCTGVSYTERNMWAQ